MITVGKQAEERQIKHYSGVGAYEVVAVNPTKEEIAKLQPWRKEIKDTEVSYVTEREGVPMVKFDFYIKLVGVKKGTVLEGVEISEDGEVKDFPVDRITYFMQKTPAKSTNKGTYQVVDAYGDSAWVNIVDGKVVFDENRQYGISTEGLRTAFSGEVAVLDLLKALFNTPRRVHFEAGGVVKVDIQDNETEKLSAARFQFEHPEKFFDGNWSEIVQPLKDAKGYRVKLLRGLRTVNGSQYSDFYTSRPMSNAVTSYGFLDKSLKNDLDNGRLSDRCFGNPPFDFMEVVNTPTDTQSLANVPVMLPDSPVTAQVFDPVFNSDMPSY